MDSIAIWFGETGVQRRDYRRSFVGTAAGIYDHCIGDWKYFTDPIYFVVYQADF